MLLAISVFFAISISASFALTVGDYRSAGTGDWKILATWQRYDGTSWLLPTAVQGWPGQLAGTGAVNIEAGHTVTISLPGITTLPMGTLTISGTLYLAGDNTAGGIDFSLTTQNIIVIPDLTPKANIYFLDKSNLLLPLNATIYVRAGGLTSKNCSNQQSIFFGPVQFYSCAGGGSACGKFADLMNFGGNPIITLTSAAGSNIQTDCVKAAITPITYVVGHGAAGAIVTGLPSGVTGTYNSVNFTFTLSGTPTVSGTFNYTVTTTGPGTCVNAIASGTITVNSIPAAPTAGTITQPTCIVSTGSVVLSGLPVGNWTINPGAVFGTGATTTISGLAASGTYNFTVTNDAGCTSVASANVVINAQPPTPSAPLAGAITHPTCTVSTGSIELNGLPAAGNWTLTTTPGGTTTIGTGTTTTIFGLIAGTYSYTVTNATGCTSEASANVVITTQPQTPTSPLQTIDCSSGSGNAIITLTSPIGAGMEYSLDGGSSYQVSTNFTGVPDGNYSITVRNTSGCTTTGGNFNVLCTCGSVPAIALSSISGRTCSTTPITISGNTFTNAASVTITEDGDGSVIPGGTGASPFDFTYSPAAGDAGTTVTITVTTDSPIAPCVAAIATYTLTVNSIPTAPAGIVTQPTCGVATGDIALSGLPATGIWTLKEMPGGTITAGTGVNTTIYGLTADTYNYTVTNSFGCTSGTSADMVVNAQPVTPAAPSVAVADNCDGTFTLTASGYTGALLWSTGEILTPITVAAGTYTVTQTDQCTSLAGSGTAAMETIPPTFTRPPDITINTDATCQYDDKVTNTGDATLLNDNCPGLLNATFSDVSAIDCEGSKIITRTWSLVDKNGNAAPNQVQFIRVVDNISPTFARPIDIAIPTDAFGVYDASVAVTGDVTNEADNCSTGINATFIDSAPVIVGCDSEIKRTWSLVDNCGNIAPDQVQTITITGNLKPVSVSIGASANPICAGTSVTFTATPGNGGTTPAYQWNNGGIAVAGETAATYTSTTLAGNDKITVVMTSNETCTSGSPATSNMITMIMTPTVGTPVFDIGPTSTRYQIAETVPYTATATNSTEIKYSLDALSEAGGNSIDAGTGVVTYDKTWSGTSTITASASGCSGPTTATHTVRTDWCFALFAGVGAIHNDLASVVTGDIGTNAGAVDGFSGSPEGTLIGQSHIKDAVTLQAKTDLNALYAALDAKPVNHVITTLDDGDVIQPGVSFLGAAAPLNGELFIDAQGNPDAIFIIKIGGALSTAANSKVTLINNASINNVFWLIDGAVNIGINSIFQGTFIGTGEINLTSGSKLYGRALTKVGAITLTNCEVSSICAPFTCMSDIEPPTFIAPTGPFEYCVESIISAEYVSNALQLNADPDAYIFRKDDTQFDLDPSKFADNCCVSNALFPLNIRWTIDFNLSTGQPPVSGTGQPSKHLSDIPLWGDGVTFNPVVHKITWWIKDCSGNESLPIIRNITINPRPKLN